MINIALFGNPNVGKTTVFNLLTGSNQYVGNWPGVTIEKKEGYLNEDIKEQTLKVSLENILQEEYKGQWIEKVQLYYEGELLSLN